MNDTTFSCNHSSNSHPFLSAGKQSEMSKRSQESSSLGSPRAKAKACCLVSPQGVSVGQNSENTPKAWRVRDTLKCRPGKKEVQTPDVVLFCVPRGTVEYLRKVVQKNERPTRTRRKQLGNIDGRREDISIWTRIMASSMQAALHMDPSYEHYLERFKNFEFENTKGLCSITTIMIEENSEIKSVFSADAASSLWEKPYCLMIKL